MSMEFSTEEKHSVSICVKRKKTLISENGGLNWSTYINIQYFLI